MMKPEELANSNYNYYPRTMISLCVISYEDMSRIPGEVSKLGLNVVWGPAEWKDPLGVSYSRMYVAMNPATQEYTVVIRGTNPLSIESWIFQDFDIDDTQPFNKLAPHAPANALISQGTFNGMNDLISLKDPKTGENVVQFLLKTKPRYLFVTGHSLGGTLTPPMLAYLNDILYGGGYLHNMADWSFAGLTSGDANFARYYNSLSNPVFPWRIHNPLDVAPFLFYSESDVQNIYNAYGLPWSSADILVRGAIDGLFLLAKGKNYTQPTGDQVLPAVFNSSEKSWVDQASYQHHSTTYQILVNQQYP